MADSSSANLSNQNIYVHACMSDGPKSYTVHDKVPLLYKSLGKLITLYQKLVYVL